MTLTYKSRKADEATTHIDGRETVDLTTEEGRPRHIVRSVVIEVPRRPTHGALTYKVWEDRPLAVPSSLRERARPKIRDFKDRKV